MFDPRRPLERSGPLPTDDPLYRPADAFQPGAGSEAPNTLVLPI